MINVKATGPPISVGPMRLQRLRPRHITGARYAQRACVNLGQHWQAYINLHRLRAFPGVRPLQMTRVRTRPTDSVIRCDVLHIVVPTVIEYKPAALACREKEEELLRRGVAHGETWPWSGHGHDVHLTVHEVYCNLFLKLPHSFV